MQQTEKSSCKLLLQILFRYHRILFSRGKFGELFPTKIFINNIFRPEQIPYLNVFWNYLQERDGFLWSYLFDKNQDQIFPSLKFLLDNSFDFTFKQFDQVTKNSNAKIQRWTSL